MTPIFTEVVKDVIGDDPVLDQYDVDYDASFYGKMIDDHVTGTMLVVLPSFKVGSKRPIFSTSVPSRGRAFSKYYSSTAPILDDTYGSSDVTQVPHLSYRLVPWDERVSHTNYRNVQCFDETERYYDSCVPDYKDCLKSQGRHLWTPSNASNTFLSPFRNVVTGNVAFVTFNGSQRDRSGEGFDIDPLNDDTWTWSYPFEARYSSVNRLANMTFNATTVIQANVSVDGVESPVLSKKPRPTKGLIPILPGRIPYDLLGTGSNGYRSTYSATGSSGEAVMLTLHKPRNLTSSRFDDDVAHGNVVPADVRLDRLNSHGYLVDLGFSDVGSEKITGSMTDVDLFKFLYGFGDLNTVCHDRYLFDDSAGVTAYTQSFTVNETASSASYHMVQSASYFGDTLASSWLEVSWSMSPNVGQNPWRAACRTSTYLDSTNYFGSGSSVTYNTISGSSVKAPGVYWVSSSSPSNSWVLVSDTIATFGGDATSSSICVMDVTSSYPWILRYKRAVVGSPTSGLYVFFSGLPGRPSGEASSSGVDSIQSIEVVLGDTYVTMSQYDTRVSGVGKNPYVGASSVPHPYPYDPGEYRVTFDFRLGSSTSSPTGSLAAIDDVEIVQYTSASFDIDRTSRIGGNNYPTFRTRIVDTRFNPTYGSYTPQTSGSSELYRSHHYGVAPIIRGWKHGLVSGLPHHTRAVFRRDHFGHFRDMLEQRQYTKFINVESTIVGNEVFSRDVIRTRTTTVDNPVIKSVKDVGSSPVNVQFVRRTYTKDDRGIGHIYVESVSPTSTDSCNVSTEATSSMPYFDGKARNRLRLVRVLPVRDRSSCVIGEKHRKVE